MGEVLGTLTKLMQDLGSTLAGVDKDHVGGLALYATVLAAVIAAVSSFVVAFVNNRMTRAGAISADVRKYRQEKLAPIQKDLRDSMAHTWRVIQHPTRHLLRAPS